MTSMTTTRATILGLLATAAVAVFGTAGATTEPPPADSGASTIIVTAGR